MRDLLRDSLARSLRGLSQEDRLAAALSVVCGPALAAHCRIEGVEEGGTALIRVDGSHWLRPLLSMRDVLQRDLARTSGVDLRDLQFALMDRPRSPRGKRVSGEDHFVTATPPAVPDASRAAAGLVPGTKGDV